MKYRIVGLALGGVVLFSVLIAHFFSIQVVQGEYWSARARRQHYFFVQEPFIRGSFYSNSSIKKGHPETPQRFVFDVQKFHLHIDPQSLPPESHPEVIEFLLTKLDIPAGDLIAFYEQFEKKNRDRLLKMWIDPDVREEILGWWRGYARGHGIPQNALFFVSDYQRSYPFGKMLGQVLHTVQSRRDEATKQATPTGGLELSFNPYLQGKLGRRRLMRSPRHSMELGEVEELPENGADIYLTVNHYLQAIAEEELVKGVIKARAKGGLAIIMNPYTGEILALAQYPFFHPSHYQEYFNDPEKTPHTRLHALVDVSEPGSVMKPFTMMTALMANAELKKQGKPPIFDPEAKIRTDDGTFPGRSAPIKDVRLHKYLNMAMGLQKSSNIYMAKTIDDVVGALGNDWYRQVLTETFGFGERTGLEFPGENSGLVPRPGHYHPNGRPEWSLPTPYSLAMGYNLETNSIQLLRAWSIIANGGFKVQPTLVRKIIKGNEVIFDRSKHSVSPKRVVDPEIVEQIKTALRYVTMPGGSGKRANIPGYTEIGKSRTTRKIVEGVYTNKKHISSFMGFAPVDKPEFVLIVTMDEPAVFYIPGVGTNLYGGVCAAPVFREIAKKTLEYLGVPPDDPYGYPKGDPRADPEKAIWARETRLLNEKYDSWNK